MHPVLAAGAGAAYGPVPERDPGGLPGRAGRLGDVVDAINATGYGLTFGVHSRIDDTIDRVVGRVQAGNIYVNRNIIGAVVGSQPFGGEGLSGTGFKAGGPNYLLRFATAGSVDDGKSTLIGRLLYDTKTIFEDQLESVEAVSAARGDEYTNLALLTDGLRAEREQGITIDVAYRYFATPRRKFIIADTPGHIQYTRNMVTGASTADLALILVDARKGLVEQSRRHAFLTSLLRVPHLVLCVNKMDLVDDSQEVFERIADEFTSFAAKLEAPDLTVIPRSG